MDREMRFEVLLELDALGSVLLMDELTVGVRDDEKSLPPFRGNSHLKIFHEVITA